MFANLPPNTIQIAVAVGAALLFMAVRMQRMSQARPLRVERLWVVPAIFAAVTVIAFVETLPSVGDAPWLIGAAVLGAVIGWYRGKMMRITVDPKTHALNQSASPAALIFLLLVFGLRYGLRYALGAEVNTWGVSLSVLADGPLVLVVAMFALARVEMFIRAQRLLREAREAHTTTPVTSQPGD